MFIRYSPHRPRAVVALAIAVGLVAGACGAAPANQPVGHSEQGAADPPRPEPPVLLDPGLVAHPMLEGFGPLQAVAIPEAGAYPSGLYVVVDDLGVLLRLDGTGAVTLTAPLPDGPIGACVGIAFDPTFGFGGALVVGFESEGTYAVDPVGRFIKLDATPRALSALACDVAGLFDHDLLIADQAGAVLRQSGEGDMTTVATGFDPSGVELAFSGGGALYVADARARAIFRIDGDKGDDPLTLWLDLAQVSEHGRPGSLAISQGGAFGSNLLYLHDRDRRRLGVFDMNGHPQGDLIAGLADVRSLQMPTDGAFADRMILVAADAIWIIERTPNTIAAQIADLLGAWGPCADAACPDRNGDGVVDATDLILLLDVVE